ncbi:MAG: non-ribosomal peptide synthetase [Bacteroidetes bacterium]|nr:non-ribosomal peptide synthetase [Bacteroidota bacterium]
MEKKPIPITLPITTIHGRFQDIARVFPSYPALRYGERVLSYSMLDRLSGYLAVNLIERSVPGPGNVAVMMENCPEQVIAILAILKAGKAYLPLDTGFPAERNRFMLQDAGCRFLITNSQNFDLASALSDDIEVILADGDFEGYSDNPELPDINPDDHAIILYTSGSTGEPKGVIQTHANMVHFIKRLSDLATISPADRFAYYLSFGFSAHALPLLGALLNGCELKMFNVKQDNFLGFSEWFKREKITTTLMLPSFLRHFLASLTRKQSFPDLRVLFLGGETLYRSDVDKARQVFDHSTLLVNILASTEAYLSRAFVMKYDTPIGSNVVPVGYAVEDLDVLVLDDSGNPCKANSPGEIYLKSRYLTPGYWKRPEQTVKDITKDENEPGILILRTYDKGYFLENDCLVHTGRMDSMVKLRGYRIDLAEVENTLMVNEEVKEALCKVEENRQGVSHILAYVVYSGKGELDKDFLRAKAARILPDYMVPSYIIVMDTLPKNASGKSDRAALPKPDWDILEGKGEKVNPRNETEKKLQEIFENALKIQPIGVTDNFLKLGTDSLRLFVAFNDVERKFSRKLNIDLILMNPNIESLAKYLQEE